MEQSDWNQEAAGKPEQLASRQAIQTDKGKPVERRGRKAEDLNSNLPALQRSGSAADDGVASFEQDRLVAGE
jgi:hypothetical protein